MAGGAGTRLWPMSRRDRPKQLLRFIHPRRDKGSKDADKGEPRSLLELAADRLEGLIDPDRRYICTAEAYRDGIRKDLDAFADKGGNDRILGEPVGRDTVNAVGFAAAVLHKLDKDAVFAVLTADHIIEPWDVFRERIDLGFRLVEEDARRLVTFSIKPTYPATGFGYVERGSPIRIRNSEARGKDGKPQHLAFHVERFVEKPDLPRAQAYVQSGHFGWNSGMFVWKASSFLGALEAYTPENHAGLMKLAEAWGTKRQKAVLEEVYPSLPRISVDYAVMEPASRDKKGQFTVCTVQMDLSWLDVGSWPAYGQTVDADAGGNRAVGPGESHLLKSKDCLVVNPEKSHTVALLGCDDLIVVHTGDATLVMPRGRAEELKELHAAVADRLK